MMTMRINLVTRGQRVRVLTGKYAGKTGTVTRSYFFANANIAQHEYRVRLSGKGKRQFAYDQVVAI